MREKLQWGILIFLVIYMIIPWIVTRIFGYGIFRKGIVQGQIAFTFDDGPDREFTPQLLDILNKYQIKASFFVLGSKAEKYPEIILRIHREGHQIGIHNYDHYTNWFMTPWGVRRGQINRTANVIEAITGTRPVYYRPPWGILNLWDILIKKDYKFVLWSTMARDWNSQIGPEKLKKLLLNKISDGSVILLHDSGDTFGANLDAPKHMLQALEEVLLELLSSGKFRCVRIDEMMEQHVREPVARMNAIKGRIKRILVSFWMLWERCIVKLLHLVPVNSDNQLLKLRVREYHGNQAIHLADGERINKGDLIAELHFDNHLLLKLSADSPSSVHLAIQIIRKTEQLMPIICRLLQNDPHFKDVKGLYGITLIHRGAKKLGFSIIDLPRGTLSFLTQIYLRTLLLILHPQGKKRLKSKPELLVPKIIAISRKELINRYIA